MRVEPRRLVHRVGHVGKREHELPVLARVEGVDHVPDAAVGDVIDDGEHLGGVDHLRLQLRSPQRHDGAHDGVKDKLVVGHELVRGEGGEGLEEERGGARKVAPCHLIHAFVHLQPVLALPVRPAGLLQQILQLGNLLLQRDPVVVEDAEPHDAEDHLHLLADGDRLLLARVERGERALAVANLREELSLCEHRVSHLRVSQVILGVLDLRVELRDARLVPRAHVLRRLLVHHPSELLAVRRVERRHAPLDDEPLDLLAERVDVVAQIGVGKEEDLVAEGDGGIHLLVLLGEFGVLLLVHGRHLD
mmetsp:Transcript_5842/g.27020  ORF Transcript_5842/g.27020 Transcript_5842/m.27020 type:complete len:305 (-) Transcript_5842:50-964(-)